ncbi:cation:proton antiporter domain-containing protein [Clostridium sp. Marseille-P299]|uniref:cation:proton antiporter domain-containing protein n=1 Tax=Clostridium sp. Marseille-P299 TaxID=1805477 RepID=UPI000837884F|nr:cation:proton antiporter [Clostridium sp. Marseille-P299]
MLTSLALIFLLGLFLSSIFKKLKLPGLLGMIITGMLLSPYAFNLLDDSILGISPDLRQFALVIILTRAGLSLDISDLKKVGRPAILMCFVPACFEMFGVIVLAPKLLNVTILEAAIIGATIAAVSPAVIVPRMLKLLDEGYGKEHSIPQLILAGASVDDVFVIVMFTAFTSLANGQQLNVTSFVQIPISIIMGIIVGIICGLILTRFFKAYHMRDTIKVLVLLGISFLLIECESRLSGILPMSGLLAIMSTGIVIYQQNHNVAKRLSTKYNKLWVAAEVLLFVLVGATVDLNYAIKSGASAILIVLGAMLFRMFGVAICLFKTKLTKNERIFCMIAYTPKATVQAAIGAIPLAMGLPCGQTVLTVAVLSILITAPFGAICVDRFYKKLLIKTE